MAFPSHMYKDPSLYVEAKESYEKGCNGCKHRKKKRFLGRWYCQMNFFGFPNNSSDNCKWWKHG